MRDRFTTRVARYLQGGPSQRDRLVAGILDDGASLSETGEDQAVGQAFKALVRRATRHTSEAGGAGEDGRRSHGGASPSAGSSDEGGPGADRDILALAAELVGHRAAARVIENLLVAPDGEGVSELIAVTAAFPERMIPVLAEASEGILDPSVQHILARIHDSVRVSAGQAVDDTSAMSAARIKQPEAAREGNRFGG